jgi:asparagine synthetase B (glutamine-hydrolysing)
VEEISMCGFIASLVEAKKDDSFVRRRGEDAWTEFQMNGWRFCHALLSLTGNFAPQPFVDEHGKIACVYNGEIYNLPFEKSDGENLIPLYKKHGENFVRHLRGEFAIALVDFENGVTIFSTDAFRCKPIFYNRAGAASCRSALSRAFGMPQPVPMNTTIICSLKTGHERRQSVHDFDFGCQHKETYDDWVQAFERAVTERTTNKCVFFGLSSGYDSGAIHCALMRHFPGNSNWKSYTILGDEDPEILRQRGATPLPFGRKDFNWGRAYVTKYMEDFACQLFERRWQIYNDESTFAMAVIMREAKREGRRIYLSGQGADEIISDYALWPSQSDLRGVFPADLKPWRNFYGHCQEAYLAKEEHIGGAFGIETRYPFLDTNVVQEFLMLSQRAKNAYYKAPIRHYLKECGYPFRENDKKGFFPRGALTPTVSEHLRRYLP